MIGRIVIVIVIETEIVIEKEKRIDQTVRVAKRNATVAETNRRAEAQKENAHLRLRTRNRLWRSDGSCGRCRPAQSRLAHQLAL